MYWQDKYPTPAHAVRDLQLAARGKIQMTAKDLHIANVAARSGLNGLSEDPANLGSLKSFLKKVVKTATKLSPSHQIAKKLKITKFSPSHALIEKVTSAPKTKPALVSEAPATEVLPNAPAQPIPELSTAVVSTSPMSFTQTSSGGGGSTPAAVASEESFFTTPVIIGIGAAALLVLFLAMRKR
jgi:hypothetical protein